MAGEQRALALLVAVATAACGDNDFGEGPHAPLPQVVDGGGPVIDKPRVVAITWQGDPLAPVIEGFLMRLGPSDYWRAAVSEYGVGPTAILPLHITDTPAPVAITDSDVQTFLTDRLTRHAAGWPEPDGETIYAFYYPASTKFGQCDSIAGYHSEVYLPDAPRAPYIVIPRCDYGLDPLENVTYVSTHELAEATTDPFPFSSSAYAKASDYAWQTYSYGGEVGDMCTFRPGSELIDPQLGHRVQRIWSNAEAAAGHDPCVPHPPGDVYFQTAPAAEDMVTLNMSFGGHAYEVMTPGVHVPVGASRTLDVQLFSDAPVGTISASAEEWPLDSSMTQLGSVVLTWDRTSGHNNDTLHLTIAINADDYGQGYEYVILTAQVGDLRQLWPITIAN